MIEHNKAFQETKIICDECGEDFEYSGDKGSAVKAAESEGWLITKFNKRPAHFCPDHSDTIKEKSRRRERVRRLIYGK